MSSKQVLWGLVPWLLYAVLTIPDGDRASLLAAVVAARLGDRRDDPSCSRREAGRRSSSLRGSPSS